MAEILSFLSQEECLALVDMQSHLVHLVDITQLLAPKGWTSYIYSMGSAESKYRPPSCPPPPPSSTPRLAVVGVQAELDTRMRGPPCLHQDGLLFQAKALLHVSNGKSLNLVSDIITEFVAMLHRMPHILMGKGKAVKPEDWIRSRLVVAVMTEGRGGGGGGGGGGGYRITMQRRGVPQGEEWEDMFSLPVSADPVRMTTSFLEEVPSVCRFNQAMNEDLTGRVGAYRSVGFDFKEGRVIFTCPRDGATHLPMQRRIPFQLAGIYDPAMGVFAWGWAIEHIPAAITESVALLAKDGGKDGQALGIHHRIFQEASVRCDDRLAMVLAGFVAHRLRSKYSMVYRHHDPELNKVFYLALDNEDETLGQEPPCSF